MSEYLLTKQQLMVKELTHKIAEEQIKPIAAEIDEKEIFPRESIDVLARAGILGCPYPEELGGSGIFYLLSLRLKRLQRFAVLLQVLYVPTQE